MWVWRAMEKVRWVDKVKNDEVLRRMVEERRILKIIENIKSLIKKRQLAYKCHGGCHRREKRRGRRK